VELKFPSFFVDILSIFFTIE